MLYMRAHTGVIENLFGTHDCEFSFSNPIRNFRNRLCGCFAVKSRDVTKIVFVVVFMQRIRSDLLTFKGLQLVGAQLLALRVSQAKESGQGGTCGTPKH